MDTLGSHVPPLDPPAFAALEEVAEPEEELLPEEALPALPSRSLQPAAVGRVLAFVGSKGGCGVTLLSVNLAIELAHNHRVCIIDLAGSNGDVAAYLDLQCGHQLAELLQADHIDGALLNAVATRHRSDVAVIAQPTNLADVALLEPHRVARVIDAARLAYDIVLIDCATHLEEATLTAVLRADVVALVLTPDVPSVRNAHRRLQLFDQLQVARSHVRLVVNHGTRHQQLSVDQIEDHLARYVAAVVREDVSACGKADMHGLPLAELPGRSRIDDDIHALGPALLDDLEPPGRVRGRFATWLHGLFRRRST